MIQLLEDRLIIEPETAPEKTRGGIILPTLESSKLEPQVGTVTHCGDGRYSERFANWRKDGDSSVLHYEPPKVPLRVRVGDKVVYNAYAVTRWEYLGKAYSIITERDVLGVLHEDKPSQPGVSGK